MLTNLMTNLTTSLEKVTIFGDALAMLPDSIRSIQKVPLLPFRTSTKSILIFTSADLKLSDQQLQARILDYLTFAEIHLPATASRVAQFIQQTIGVNMRHIFAEIAQSNLNSSAAYSKKENYIRLILSQVFALPKLDSLINRLTQAAMAQGPVHPAFLSEIETAYNAQARHFIADVRTHADKYVDTIRANLTQPKFTHSDQSKSLFFDVMQNLTRHAPTHAALEQALADPDFCFFLTQKTSQLQIMTLSPSNSIDLSARTFGGAAQDAHAIIGAIPSRHTWPINVLGGRYATEACDEKTFALQSNSWAATLVEELLHYTQHPHAPSSTEQAQKEAALAQLVLAAKFTSLLQTHGRMAVALRQNTMEPLYLKIWAALKPLIQTSMHTNLREPGKRELLHPVVDCQIGATTSPRILYLAPTDYRITNCTTTKHTTCALAEAPAISRSTQNDSELVTVYMAAISLLEKFPDALGHYQPRARGSEAVVKLAKFDMLFPKLLALIFPEIYLQLQKALNLPSESAKNVATQIAQPQPDIILSQDKNMIIAKAEHSATDTSKLKPNPPTTGTDQALVNINKPQSDTISHPTAVALPARIWWQHNLIESFMLGFIRQYSDFFITKHAAFSIFTKFIIKLFAQTSFAICALVVNAGFNTIDHIAQSHTAVLQACIQLAVFEWGLKFCLLLLQKIEHQLASAGFYRATQSVQLIRQFTPYLLYAKNAVTQPISALTSIVAGAAGEKLAAKCW